MKALSGNMLVRVALLFAAMGAAFLLGHSQQKAESDMRIGQNISAAGSGPMKYDAQNDANGKNATKIISGDHQSDLAELAQLPRGKKAQDAYFDAFLRWLIFNPSDVQAALAAALALPPGKERIEALHGAIYGWAGVDPAAAFAWAAKLPQADADALMESIMSFGNDKPKIAAQYVDAIPDAAGRNEAIGQIAKSMAELDPAATLDWLDQVATGSTYDNGIKNLFASLGQNDPTTGATILAKLSDPSDRNVAIDQLATKWGGKDPAAAFAWVQSLSEADNTARVAALNFIFTSWSKSNPPAALNALQSANLSDAERATLEQSLNSAATRSN